MTMGSDFSRKEEDRNPQIVLECDQPDGYAGIMLSIRAYKHTFKHKSVDGQVGFLRSEDRGVPW
jgi:hypothetical protein